MSDKVYEAIKLLDSKEERSALRALFTLNPDIEARAERTLRTCEDSEEVVNYFKKLLKPGMFSHSRVIFASNTEYLLILVLFSCLLSSNPPKKHIHVIVEQPVA